MRKMWLFGAVAFSTVFGIVSIGLAAPWLCGWDNFTSRAYYPFDPNGDEITAKFVFVGFPEDPVDTLMHANLHQVLADTVAWYFDNLSRGKLQFSEESGILFKPGFEGFNSQQTSAETWMADLPARFYRNRSPREIT